MARTVKTAEVRQDEILEVAARLFADRGYDKTSIKAIIDEVGIAKGTFYHHFRSKEALLDGLFQGLSDVSLALVQPLLDDPDVGAIDKFVGFYHRIGAWKVSQRGYLIELSRALADDANARLQKSWLQTVNEIFVPILSRIIEQGIDEGVFDTRFPLLTAQAVMQVSTSLSLALQAAVMSGESPDLSELERICDALEDSIERLLGAPTGSITLLKRSDLALWVQAAGAKK